jgi:hypothetical protein
MDMSKKASPRKTPPHVTTYEMRVVWDDEYQNHWGMLTWFENFEPFVTCTAAHPSISEVCHNLIAGMVRAQADLRDGHLLLPDMGDYQLKYHDRKVPED